MAILDALKRIGRARSAVIAALTLTLTGCVVFQAFTGREKRFAFSHKTHSEELDCDACHMAFDSADEPGMPALKQCALCHAEIDAEKPPERKVDVLFGAKGFLAANVSELGDERVFSHLAHVSAEIDCAACHTGIETNEDVLDLPKVDMARCVDCHAEKQVANECRTCHTTLREDVKPPSHDTNWFRTHGGVVCARDEATASQCSMCHNESSCVSCHRETPPQNHTNYWRLRGHGVTASLDRESCATCHTADSCASCHASSPPQNHTGAWGGVVNQHCVSCHFPVQNEGCVVCHAGTPSHAQATPKPPDHTAGMNCRMCHGVGQPLPHVDNGDNCNLCHQ